MISVWGGIAAVASVVGFAVPLSIGSGLPASATPTGRIIYNATSQTGVQSDIYSASPAGTGVTKLTHGTGESFAGSYSPQRGRIAFVRGGVTGRLWTMTATGTDARPLGSGSLAGSCPRYSPAGGRIAYRTGDFGEIHMVNADGTHDRRISGTATTYDQCPSWSPDGTRLAFVRYSSFSSADVWVMRDDGTHATRLTTDGVLKSAVAWSPDGRTIAYDRGGDLWLTAPTGRDQHALTETAGTESDPVWSPHSDQIVYAYAQGPSFVLRIIDAHGRWTKAVGVAGSPAAWH
ncbi:MAG: hypothetical protein JWO79_1715 [Actinomycetia bacterium]|nr:hypothetical protein [Actinomycetes bacterium]